MSAKPAVFGVIERLDPRFDEVIPSDAVLERVAEGIEWGEGPLWDPVSGSLLFSDIPRNGIFRWAPGSGITLALDRSGYTGAAPFTGREPGSNGLTFDLEGQLVIAQHGNRRIVRREHDGRLDEGRAARFAPLVVGHHSEDRSQQDLEIEEDRAVLEVVQVVAQFPRRAALRPRVAAAHLRPTGDARTDVVAPGIKRDAGLELFDQEGLFGARTDHAHLAAQDV